MGKNERTFIVVKPDGVQRGLVGEIIKRFEQRGYKLIAMKMVHATTEHLLDLKEKPVSSQRVQYMHSGPVVAMVWEGYDVVKTGQTMLGTIHGDFSITEIRNLCHGSDSVESAKSEISHWFKEEELVDWSRAIEKHIHEDSNQ